VLKKKFADKKNKKDFEYIPATVEEEPGYLYMQFNKNVNFYIQVETEIKLKKDTAESSLIMIRMKEHNRQWNYSLRNKKLDEMFYNALLNRLKTGRWTPMPWEQIYRRKRKPDAFQ
jgi:hypothetical protein